MKNLEDVVKSVSLYRFSGYGGNCIGVMNTFSVFHIMTSLCSLSYLKAKQQQILKESPFQFQHSRDVKKLILTVSHSIIIIQTAMSIA